MLHPLLAVLFFFPFSKSHYRGTLKHLAFVSANASVFPRILHIISTTVPCFTP